MEKKLDKKKYLRNVIIVSWIGLAVCFIIKLFGENLFEIACTNENFIAVCNYADTHLWLNYIISALYCFISLYFFTLAILQRTKYKLWEFIVVIITVLAGTAVKVFWNSVAGLVFDIWQGFIMPIIFLNKEWRKYFNIVIANVCLFAFQAISMYAKNIDFGVLGASLLIDIIYSIDVLIMIVLYFAYANINIKEKNKESEVN